MLRLPRSDAASPSSQYEPMGLKDLPFPTEPVLDPKSGDPRRDGSIYAKSPVMDAVLKFEQLLIRPNDFHNRVKLASLWSKGDSQQGRGMGKTALLRSFQKRINSDWGNSEFKNQWSAVVIYVAFPVQVDRRYMEQLAWAALVDTCRSGVLEAALAALRFEVLSPPQVKAVVQASGGEDYANLLDDDILLANQITPQSVNSAVKSKLLREDIGQESAEALSKGKFEDFLRSLRKDGNLEPYYIPRMTKGLDYSRSLFFNDIVIYLRAAGFSGGYLFVDDIENLVDQMTRKHRLEFAKEFGICTVRPGYANVAHNFFSCVLTTHQSSSVPLAQAWTDAGLSAIARLDPDAPTSVELPLPTQDQAREIIIAHLDHYRIENAENGTITPFTVSGLDELVGASQRPRDLLANAARICLLAVDKGLTSLDADLVREAIDSGVSQPITDFSSDLDEAL